MKDPKLIESISTDIIDEEEEMERHQVGEHTGEMIDKEFETLRELGIIQKDLDYKIEEVIDLLEKNKEISSKVLKKLKEILKSFEKEFKRTKNSETKLSMIRYIIENIFQIKIKLLKYKWEISETEIKDILHRQEAQFQQSSKSSNAVMDADSKIPPIWIIWWIIIVCLVIFLIFKLF